MLDQFCMVSGIHPNLSKNEMTGNGFLKKCKGGTLWTEKFAFNQREH